jgi:DHA2 family multidrug resistance protein
VAAVLYAFTQAATDGWGSSTVLGFLGGGVTALCLFVIVELETIHRGKQPLLDLRAFADRAFTSSVIALVFVTFILFGGLFLLPLYLQILRGLSPFQAGLFLLPQALASMVVMVTGGRLTDKFGTQPIVVPGLVFLVVPLWGLSHLTSTTPYGWFQVLLIMRGVEFGLVAQPLMRAALVSIPQAQLSQASSLITVIRFIAGAMITPILGTIVQTQQQVHYVHLAERVVPGSPLGQFIALIQARLVARGMDLVSAQHTAMLGVIRLVGQQAYALALQDGYRLTFWLLIPAILAVLLIPYQRMSRTKEAKGAREETLSLA